VTRPQGKGAEAADLISERATSEGLLDKAARQVLDSEQPPHLAKQRSIGARMSWMIQ
jgi:hypothetical protein